MAKKTAFASMTIGELESALQQNMRELYKARLESSSGQLKTSHVIRLRRLEIARLKTALHAKVTPASVTAVLAAPAVKQGSEAPAVSTKRRAKKGATK